jgi:glycosyltransferase involved in cell wall biosynthesis
MPRIVLIAGAYLPERCGVAHYTHHLRHRLYQQKIDSVILTTHKAAQESPEKEVIGVVSNWHLTQIPALIKAIHSVSADILHIQHAAGTYGFDRSLFLLPLLLKLTGYRTPIVATVHEYGWWEWQPSWLPSHFLEWLKIWGQRNHWWDREDGFLLTGSNAIITTNSDATETIRSRLPHLENIYQIPIGANIAISSIDRHQAVQKVRQIHDWSMDTIVVAFFGFLHPVKGIETLLAAFQPVVERHPHARLLLIGGVESLALPKQQAEQYWNRLQEAIATARLTQYVAMTGYLDETMASQYLTGSDIGVLPFNHGVTLKSGSLLALLAHGLPVVATRPPAPDPNFPESCACLVPPRNGDELAMAITRLVEDGAMRQRLSLAGHRFSQNFSWSGIAEAHADIYRSLLAQNCPPESELAV